MFCSYLAYAHTLTNALIIIVTFQVSDSGKRRDLGNLLVFRPQCTEVIPVLISEPHVQLEVLFPCFDVNSVSILSLFFLFARLLFSQLFCFHPAV